MKELWLDAFKASIRNRVAQHESGDNTAKSESIKFSIAENMTEEERYNELKDKSISLSYPNVDKIANIDLESYRTLKTKDAKKPIRQLAKLLDIHNVNYSNSSIDFDFGFSVNSLNTSINHQQEYGGDYTDYAKMLSCIDELIQNAQLIEVHKDHKNNADLNKTYVLFSAFVENNSIYPVQFEVKEYYSAEGRLYLNVVLTKIEKSAVVSESHVEKSIASPRLLADSIISLPQLFANVNPADARFLKYVPDGFLSDEQIAAKRNAQGSDYEKYGRYKEVFENDLRHSIPEQTDGEYEALLHENEQLQQQIETLKSAMQITKGHKVNPAAVQKFARKLIKDYSSTVDVDSLSERLENVFNYIASEDAIGSLAQEVMYSIAKDVLTQSESYNTELSETYKETRDFLRNTKIHVSDGAKAELDYIFGSYNTFRKANFGRLKLSINEGQAIDDVYQELATLAPGYFSDQMLSDKDMLPNIAEFIQATNPFIENVYEQDMEQYIADLAQEIFNQYFETPEVKTFADKQANKLQKAVNKSRKYLAERREADQQRYAKQLERIKNENKAKIERLQDSINDMRDKNYQATKDLKAKLYAQIGELKSKQQEKLLAQKAKYQDMAKRKAERNKENAEATKHRKSIKKNAREIIRWFDNPSDQKHIPEKLRKTVAEFLTSIDFLSDHQEADAISKGASKEVIYWGKAAERLYRVIANEQANIDNENNEDDLSFALELDPDFLPLLSDIIENGQQYKRISEMNAAQLKDLDTLITSLKHATTSINRLYTNRVTENVAELGNMTTDDLYSRDTKKNHAKIVEQIDKVLNVSMLIPMDFFERMGIAGESIYRSFKDADNKFVSNVEKTQNFMEDLLKDKDVKSWINKSEIYEVEAGGKTL